MTEDGAIEILSRPIRADAESIMGCNLHTKCRTRCSGKNRKDMKKR